MKHFLSILLIFIFAAGGFFLLEKKGIFTIQTIEVIGTKNIEETEVIEIYKKHQSSTNIFFIRKEILTSTSNPAIESIIVSKDIFHRKLLLKVIERNPLAIICSSSHSCFYFDKQGIIFGDAPRIQGGKILVFDFKESDKKITIGDSVISPRFLPHLVYLASHPPKNILLNKVTIDEHNQEIRATITPSQGTLFFSLRFSPEEPLIALDKLTETKKPDPFKLSILDFRIQNRFYYQ